MVNSWHLRYSTIIQIAHKKIVPTQIKKALLGCTLLILTGLLASCGGSSSGGIYNQAFNLSGQWSGSIQDATNPDRSLKLTLSDNAGTVTGTLIVTDHSCLTSTSLTGTSVQASANSSGDNPLTGDQENSNEGTASLSMTTTETVDTTETTFTVTFTLSGTSKSLSGQYSGTWPSSGSGCRSDFQGTISITLD